MKKAFMRALVCALCGALAFSGVNIPSSVAESNTKEMNQMDEKYVVASYPNVLNLPSDKIDRMIISSFNPTIDNLERLLWICLKINGKKTLLLADYVQIFYDSDNGPLIQGVNNDPTEDNEKYFLDKKQTLEDMSRYLTLTKFSEYLSVNGYKIVDLFRSENLIGIYNKNKFYHNRNFFDNKEEIELVFSTNDINELANLISIDLSKYNLPERIKKNMEDGSTKISLKDVYDLYMTIVPDEYLPTLTQRKFNINPTVPIFKDEILKKNINERAEELGYFILPTKSGETKFLFYYLDFKTLYYHDFYTREKIAKYGDTDFNKEYLNKLNVSENFYIEDSNGVFNYLKRISNDNALFVDEYLPGLDYLFTLSFTYGDFIDFYQKIPLDQQIDYSFYDFSKSPIIDQYDPAWFADRPAFVPTPVPTPSPVPTPAPTPPPYQELTLGSRGQAVLDMKGRFYELGYFRTTEFSDQFNKNTADTVRLFETNNGLPVDGVADAVMLALLFSDGAVGK